MLAALDRWLVSSIHARYRQMRTITNARRGTILIILFSCILYIHAPICYEIAPNNFPVQCYGKNQLCRVSVDLVYGVITIVVPIILMGMFSFKTILNIRRMKNRIRPVRIETYNGSTGTTTTLPSRPENATDRLFIMLSTRLCNSDHESSKVGCAKCN